jgi:hypothetical protein
VNDYATVRNMVEGVGHCNFANVYGQPNYPGQGQAQMGGWGEGVDLEAAWFSGKGNHEAGVYEHQQRHELGYYEDQGRASNPGGEDFHLVIIRNGSEPVEVHLKDWGGDQIKIKDSR